MWGGKRSGAGRKLKPYSELRIPRTISLKRCEWNALDQKECAKLLSTIASGIERHGQSFLDSVKDFIENYETKPV